jgi:hypothetical protein
MRQVKWDSVLSTSFYLSLSIFILLLSGCMVAPQNNQEVNATLPIQFSGSVPLTEDENHNISAAEIEIRDVPMDPRMAIIRNMRDGSSIPPVASFPVSTTNPQTDGSGKKWYSWGGKKIIPFGLWSAVPGRSELQVRVKAQIKNTGLFLATFDFGAQSNPNCVAKKDDPSFLVRIDACKSDESPVVTLTSDCGDYKDPCCKSDSGAHCVAHYECTVANYVPNSDGEGDDYFGDVSEPRLYTSGPMTAPSGRELVYRCLAEMPGGVYR